jgi:hypothetical protein
MSKLNRMKALKLQQNKNKSTRLSEVIKYQDKQRIKQRESESKKKV